jgi:DNA adenine methylase
MTSTSPLRYPGGKARFTDFILQALKSSGENANIFIEPFCGGVGAGIALLESKKVSQIAINDCDPLVASFWKVVFGKGSAFKRDFTWLVNKVELSQVNMDEWKRLKAFIPRSTREAAWKCLFLNRTSFNGIIHKAGPIGGWNQINRKIDVRFNRERLLKRLEDLYQIRGQVISVGAMDWRLFSHKFRKVKGSYLYLDPPYFNRSEQLYGYIFKNRDHENLRNYLSKLSRPWMLSYDDAKGIRDLYSKIPHIHGKVIGQTYSTHPKGGASFVGRELFYSNRPLPFSTWNSFSNNHIGLTVLGCINEVHTVSEGPIRIPLIELGAVGS